jgi:hypothetical protein
MKRIDTVTGAMIGGLMLAAIVACGGGNHHDPQFRLTPLVSDGAVSARHIDTNLKNPWGIAFNPKGFVWVADNGSQNATLYDGDGVPQSLVVSIPPAQAGQQTRPVSCSTEQRTSS